MHDPTAPDASADGVPSTPLPGLEESQPRPATSVKQFPEMAESAARGASTRTGSQGSHPATHQRQHRPQDEDRTVGAQTRAFIAWPEAASLITLLSAASLLGGAWGLLAPTIGDPGQVTGRLAVSGILATYLAALLGVVWAMCRWQPANPDGIAASVVGAAFTIAAGLTLDLVATDCPYVTLLLGAGGLGLSLVTWRIWNRATSAAPATGRAEAVAVPVPLTPHALRLPLLLIAGWSFLWPGAMGLNASLTPTGAAGPDRGLAPMILWLPGWWLVLAAALLLVVALARGATPWTAAERGFLARPAMRWVQALVMLATAGLHQFVLGYTAGLDLAWSDFAPLAALLLVLGNELRAAARPGLPGTLRDCLAFALPGAGLVALVLAATPAAIRVPTGDSGDWLIQAALRATVSPEATLLLLTAGGAELWLHRRRNGLALGSLAALLTAVLIWDAHDGPGMHPAAAAVTAAVAAILWAAWRRRPAQALVAAVILEVALALIPAVHDWLTEHQLGPAALVALVVGMTVLVGVAILPSVVSRRVARLSAWVALAGLLGALDHRTHGDPSPLPLLPWLAIPALIAALATAAWRARDWATALPLAVIGLCGLPYVMPANKAWLGIWAAFGLLGVALAVGWRRLAEARRIRLDPPTAR